MARPKFKRDPKAIEELMLSARFQALVEAKAQQVAASARSQYPDVEVTVESYEWRGSRRWPRRRALRSVALADPAGLAIQAKYGVLTRAAASAGMEVRNR